jgi:hypothetical protein
MIEIAILIYLMLNAYIAGQGEFNYKTLSGWLTLIGCLLLGTLVGIFIIIWNFLNRVSRSDTYRNIKFWLDLNIFGTYSKFTEKDIKRVSRTLTFQKQNSRLDREWKRVKEKYNYRY